MSLTSENYKFVNYCLNKRKLNTIKTLHGTYGCVFICEDDTKEKKAFKYFKYDILNGSTIVELCAMKYFEAYPFYPHIEEIFYELDEVGILINYCGVTLTNANVYDENKLLVTLNLFLSALSNFISLIYPLIILLFSSN